MTNSVIDLLERQNKKYSRNFPFSLPAQVDDDVLSRLARLAQFSFCKGGVRILITGHPVIVAVAAVSQYDIQAQAGGGVVKSVKPVNEAKEAAVS